MFRRPPPTKIGRSLLLMAGAGLLTLLTARPSAATTWYVDGASPVCSNSGAGDGLKPFCTIQTAANKARAGDRVLVSPATYREQVVPARSGQSSQPITYQATGPRTRIMGSLDISRPDKWQRDSATTWRRPQGGSPRQVFLDGVRLTAVPSLLDMTTNTFFHDVLAKTLYVDIGGPNPGAGHLVEASTRSFGFDLLGRSHIVLDGFELVHQNVEGVRIQGGASLTLQNLSTDLSGTYGIRVQATNGPVVVKSCTTVNSLSNGIVVVGSTGVTLENNRSHHNGFHGISLQSSSGNILKGNVSFSNYRHETRSSTGIDVNGGSSANSIIANTTYGNQDTGIQVYNGSNGNLVARNVSFGNGDHGFDTMRSAGTRYVNNTSCRNYKDGFSVEGSSVNTTLSNNIGVDNGLATGQFDLFVDPLSISGLSSDYNIFFKSGPGRAVRVNGVIYQTLNQFRGATSYEDHGVDADPMFSSAATEAVSGPGTESVSYASMNLRLTAGSPAIDSANSSASGFVELDRDGASPSDDPRTSNTGSGRLRFVDRGAYEFDAAPVADLMLTPSSGEIGVVVTADASRSSDNDTALSFTFDFGDGTIVGPGPSPTATHTFATPGVFTVMVTVTDRGGKSSTVVSSVTVQDRAPGARLVVSPAQGPIDLPVVADASASRGTDLTPIASYTFDFGDGTVVGPQAGSSAPHTYTTPGTYTVLVTVTNRAGRNTEATYQVIVRDDPPEARLSVTPAVGITNLTVTADASSSRDLDATPIGSYTFDFGDGVVIGPQASPVASHTYTTAGDFSVAVTITDTAGHSSIARASVKAVVNSAPLASLTVTPATGRKPVSVTADASASTDTDPAPIASYTFDFGDGTVVGPQASSSATHLFARKGVYTVSVTVMDTAGLSSRATRVVTVRKKGRR